MQKKQSNAKNKAQLRTPPRKIDKKGQPYYDIRVYNGYKTGKQIEKRKKYYPPEGLSREAQDQAAVRALQNLTVEVKGNASSPTFCSFAQHYLQTQELSPTTRARYADMLKLIAVNDWATKPIGDITNKDLTEFYNDLTIKGVNENANYATGKDLRGALKDRNLTVAKLSRMTGIAESTIRKAFDPDKHIQIQVADKIATALGKDINALFDVRDAEKGLSNRTIHHYHAFIRAVLGQALADGVILVNVADQAHKAFPKRMKLKKKGVDPDRYLQQDEAQRLADAVRALPEEYYKWQVAIILLLTLGLRRGELLGLEWSKINFDRNTIKIDTASVSVPQIGTVTKTTKTAESKRTLQMPQGVRQILLDYRDYWQRLRQNMGSCWSNQIEIQEYDERTQQVSKTTVKNDRLFLGDNGRPLNPSCLNKWLRNFCKTNDFQHVWPHSLRHTAATLILGQTKDAAAVKDLLGHSSLTETIDAYIYPQKSTKKEIANAMDKVFFANNAEHEVEKGGVENNDSKLNGAEHTGA